VLAGPTPPNGSSLGLEAQEFLARPTLKESVVQLSALSEAEKRWLFENSSLMLYPTVVEGFGLVPFEAAQYGLATLSTRQGSLDEVLPGNIPTIETLSVTELADLIEQLLDNKGLRESIVSALVSKSDEFTAERTTNELVELFFEVMKRPPNRVRKVIGANRQNIGWTSRLDTDLRDVVVLPGEFIKLGWKAPAIKRIISPDNSRRQSAIRKLANQIRRMR
jgi:hypothetical protein